MPIPSCERIYFVQDGDSSFPYFFGRLEIKYGSGIKEYVASFYTTGNDNRTYRNMYRNGVWGGWEEIVTNNDLAVVHARIDNLIGISLSDKPDRDINNIKTSGLFNIDPTFTNRPPQSESWMFLINTVHGGGDSNYITQFAWNMNGTKDFFCFRKKVGTWQGWQTIWEAK